MTAVAIVTLAALSLLLGAGLIWFAREARNEGRMAITQGKALLVAMGEVADRTRERDAALVDVARLAAEVALAGDRIAVLDAALAAARKDLADARMSSVLDAAPADVGPRVDRVLEARRAEQADAAARRGGDAAADPVPRPGPATDGPRPAWAGVDEH
jgi:hypothetical protein